MVDRRAVQAKCRRVRHMRMRRLGIINQDVKSSSEGPNDSPRAQQAAKATKARRA